MTVNPYRYLRYRWMAHAIVAAPLVLVVALLLGMATWTHSANARERAACLVAYRNSVKPEMRDRLLTPADPCAWLVEMKGAR